MSRAVLVAAICGVLLASSARAHEPVELPELMQAFGTSLEDVEITSKKVRDGLYVLFGSGGNVAVSIGPDGVLMVDDQFPELVPELLERIRKLGGGVPSYVVNTHWHFDHAQGNLELGKGQTVLVSHVNSRRMLRSDQVINLVQMSTVQKAYPTHALPDLTFDSRMQVYWNGETVELIHPGRAHTAGDAAVLFRGRNAVHMGDVYNNAGYPFIDVDNGGSIAGTIAFCEAVLAEIQSDTVVIPGHGPLSRRKDLAAYVEMLKTIRSRVQQSIEQGAGLTEIVAANPTAEWDREHGDPAQLLDRVYHSLLREDPER